MIRHRRTGASPGERARSRRQGRKPRDSGGGAERRALTLASTRMCREIPFSSDGPVHAVRCCRVSGLIDCGTSYAAGLYGDTRVESKIVQVCSKALAQTLVFPTPSR